jgi:Flp pilus assembly protein TadD
VMSSMLPMGVPTTKSLPCCEDMQPILDGDQGKDKIAGVEALLWSFSDSSRMTYGMGTNDTETDTGRLRLRHITIIILAATVVYLPALRAGFVFDDWILLVQNPLIRAPDALRRTWFTTDALNYYPVTSTSWWLQWQLWGPAPMGYHLVNILLHGLNAALLLRVLKRLGVRCAWVAALVFAVHPVNVPSVAWISEHKNMLLMFFFLLTVLAYLGFVDGGGWRWYGASIVFFLLSLLAKPAAVMWPVALLGLAWWKNGRVTLRDFAQSLPFFVLSGAIGLLTMWFEAVRILGGEPGRSDSFLGRLACAGWAAWFYLYKALVPLRLCAIYPRWEIDSSKPVVYLPTLLLVLVLAYCWRKRRSWGGDALAGGGYFLIMLFPVLGFFDQSYFPMSFVADHYQYVAIPGVIALVVGGVACLVAKGPNCMQPAVRIVATAVLVCLGVLTWNQSRVYFNDETLWRDTIAKNPAAWLAHYNLGVILAANERLPDAAAAYETALRLKPDYAEALGNLGVALLQQGRVGEAMSRWRTAIRYRPDHVDSLNNLGAIYAQQDDLKHAALYFSLVLVLKPNDPEAHANLGSVCLSRGKLAEAAKQFQAALRINPTLLSVRLSLGVTLARLGKAQQATEQLQQVLRVEPINHVAREALLQLGVQPPAN